MVISGNLWISCAQRWDDPSDEPLTQSDISHIFLLVPLAHFSWEVLSLTVMASLLLKNKCKLYSLSLKTLFNLFFPFLCKFKTHSFLISTFSSRQAKLIMEPKPLFPSALLLNAFTCAILSSWKLIVRRDQLLGRQIQGKSHVCWTVHFPWLQNSSDMPLLSPCHSSNHYLVKISWSHN